MNIQGLKDINDPFYRYKMEKLNVVRQRNKTVINNINKVCKDLDREPNLLINFLKKKLNVALHYKNNLLTMTALITYNQFELHLREFIDYYVLCEKCTLPETILISRQDIIYLDCKCCAYKSVRNIKK